MKMLVVALVTVSTFPGVNLHHLDWLRRPVAHDQVMTWQIYAEPIKKEDRFGPFRYVGAEGEGVGCIDDVARAGERGGHRGARPRRGPAPAPLRRLTAATATLGDLLMLLRFPGPWRSW